MTIDSIFEMKREPGVVVVGGKNVGVEEVFDELNGFLSEFYLDNGFVFVSKPFNDAQTKYFSPVYIGHATIKIERFSEKRRKEFVKGWDFPHAPFEYTQQVFGVYFNLVEGDRAETERDNFLNYIKPTLN